MVTLEHSFLIDFTNMGVRGARETPIRLIVPVYTRAGARELPVEKKRDAVARMAGLSESVCS